MKLQNQYQMRNTFGKNKLRKLLRKLLPKEIAVSIDRQLRKQLKYTGV
jgi:hypothetical protein